MDVPDEEIIAPPVAPETSARDLLDQDDLLTEIRQILGPLDRPRPAASPADDKHALIDSLAEKYPRCKTSSSKSTSFWISGSRAAPKPTCN